MTAKNSLTKAFNDKFGSSGNYESTNKSSALIIEHIEKELGIEGQLTKHSSDRGRLNVKANYMLYKAVCEAKGKTPEIVYNGSQVKLREELEELESEAGESFEEFFGEVEG